MASTATLFVGRGFVAFLVGIGVGRFLGPQGRGEVVFVVTAAALLAMVATAGVVPAIHRVAQSNPTVDLARSVLGVTVARVGSVLAVAGLAWFLLGQRWYSASAFQLACTAALCLVVGLQATLVAASARAKKEVAASAWLLVGTSILLVAVVGLGIGDGLTSSIVWILWVLSQAVAVVAIFIHLFTPNGTADFGSVWRAAQSAGWGELLLSTTWRVDNLIIGLVVGIGALGRYSAAVAVAEVVLSLLNALRMVLLRQDLGDRTAVLVKTIRFTAVAAIPLTVIGAALGPWAIESTFGPSFSGLRMVLAIMIPSAMGLGLSFVLLDHAASSGKSRAAGVAAGAGLVVNVIANVVLLPRFGIEGGAAASGLAYATTLGLLMRTLRSHDPSS